MVIDALGRSPLFMAAALPLKIYPPFFNRYSGGEAFGDHIDNAVRMRRGTDFRIRSDLSATLFLADPDSYEGGGLVIEGMAEAPGLKLPAGHLILYPSSTVHRVEPVTGGVRVASFMWDPVDDPRSGAAQPVVRPRSGGSGRRRGDGSGRSDGRPSDRRLSQSAAPMGRRLNALRF